MINDSIAAATARGTASALWRALGESLRSETGYAMLVAAKLRQLREEHLFAVIGARTLPALLDARLPALDRSSARRLLLIGDAVAALDEARTEQIGHLSLARLAWWSTLPPAARAGMIEDAEVLPLHELRRRYEGPPSVPARDPFTPTRPVPLQSPQLAVAELLIGEVGRAWGQLTMSAFGVGRLLARLRDERLWSPPYDSLEEAAASEVELAPIEVRRALELVDRLTVIDDALREQLGNGALRALASVDDETRRAELIAAARSEHLGAEAMLSRVRGQRRRAETAPPVSTSETPPDRAVPPFNLLYLPEPAPDDPAVKSGFIGATPPALIEQILLRATVAKDRVLDLTAGTGAVARIGATWGRQVISYDILDPPLAEGVRVGDARNVAPPEAPFALIFFHPPLLGEVAYSDRYAPQQLQGDLSLLAKEDFRAACAEIIVNAKKLLRENGTLAIVAREGRLAGKLIDWPSQFSLLAGQAGFSLADRLYAVDPPSIRDAAERVGGFRALRDKHSLSVVHSVLLLRVEQRSTR